MEKRTLYIITALIILSLLSGLAFWYLYIVEQELGLNDVTELDLYNTDQGSIINSDQVPSIDSSASDSRFGNFGLNENEIITPDNDTLLQDSEEEVDEPEIWELIQIHNNPISGARIIDNSIQFTDSKTGNIFSRDNNTSTIDRLSSATVLNINKSYTLSKDSTLFIYDDKSPTLIKIIAGESTSTDTKYTDTILQSVQEDGYVYYTTPNNSGISLKSTKDTSETLWSSPLSDWLLQSIDDYIVITQKPSYNIPGYSYLLNKKKLGKGSLSLSPIVQDMPGLLVNVSPDATQLLYSTVGKGGLTLNLKDISTAEVIPLSIKTLASKCAWGNDSSVFYCAVPTNLNSRITHTLPDSWYKGQFSFTDSLWRIDSSTGDALRLASKTGLDIIELQEGSTGKLILFKDKIDQSLWAVISNKLNNN